MTPWHRFRTSCAITVVSLLLAAPAAYAEESTSPAAGPTATPGTSDSLAGRPAGEGRDRPGRPPTGSGVTRPEDTSPSAATRPGEPEDTGEPSGPSVPAESSGSPEPSAPDGSGSVSPSSAASSSAPASAAPAKPSPKRSPSAGTTRGSRHRTDETGETGRDTDEAPGLPPGAGRSPGAHRLPDAAAKQEERPLTESVVRPIPVATFGAGLVLVGLGLGFVGLRLRRR